MPASAPPTDDTSSSLLARARDQDQSAWLRLVEWIGPFLLRCCRRAGLQPADCDEVSQQALINLWRGLATFRKDRPRDSFRGWVYAITRNCIRDLQDRQRASARPLPEQLPAETDSSEAHDLQRRAIRLLIQEILARHASDRGFQAFYRTAVDGLAAPEAAVELGLSPDVVRQHKCRWVKRLRDQLRASFGELLT